MQAQRRVQPPASLAEQREYERSGINLPGTLIVPAEEATLSCQVLNLSGGGASLRCDSPPPLNTYVILCIDGFGRLEAVTKRFVENELGLQFVFNQAKRQRLLDDIDNYTTKGSTGKAHLRRHARLPLTSHVLITLHDGDEFYCEVINVSTLGLSLRTQMRPPVNEVVSIGQKYGRVARHHGEGIAIEFAGTADGENNGN